MSRSIYMACRRMSDTLYVLGLNKIPEDDFDQDFFYIKLKFYWLDRLGSK